jgi:hypothetical protein
MRIAAPIGLLACLLTLIGVAADGPIHRREAIVWLVIQAAWISVAWAADQRRRNWRLTALFWQQIAENQPSVRDDQ